VHSDVDGRIAERGREDACIIAKRSFEESVAKFGLDPEWGRKWVNLTMERLRSLLIDMEAGGRKASACYP
jgi:hypothetical protein